MTAFIMILKSMILYLLKSIKNIKAVVSLQHIKDHDFTSVIGGGGGRCVLPYIFAAVKGMAFMHLSLG